MNIRYPIYEGVYRILTIFPAILYRMKCPYSPANYLKGDYEVRAVTMKEQRTTGGELKKMQYHT